MKILVIEDEPELNQLSVESLRAAGHEVFSALSLGEAWQLFQMLGFKIDLIIADKRLPDGSGAEFALEIRQKYPNVRMAMVSGFLTPMEKDVLEGASIRCYSKPALYRKVVEDARRPPPISKPVPAPNALLGEEPPPVAPPPAPIPPEPPRRLTVPVAGVRPVIKVGPAERPPLIPTEPAAPVRPVVPAPVPPESPRLQVAPPVAPRPTLTVRPLNAVPPPSSSPVMMRPVDPGAATHLATGTDDAARGKSILRGLFGRPG